MTASLIIYNTYCQLKDESDSSILSSLDRELSYFNKNAIFSRAFKMHKWDGFTHLLNGNLTFPLGLFQRVCSFYEKQETPLILIDNRTQISNINSINIIQKLADVGKTPYSYQLDMVEIAKNNRLGVLRAATGSGKSISIALITAYFGKATNIYVIGTDLLYQMHSLFSKLFDEEIGIIGDGHCEIKRINIVSIWTVGIALGLKANEILTDDEDDKESEIDSKKIDDIKNMLSKAKVNIFDECHMCSCSTIITINQNIVSEHTYGLSASPVRDDGSDLVIESILGKTIYNLSASTLIKSKHLVRPIIKFIEVSSTNNDARFYKTVYKDYIVENPERNAKVIKAACKLVEQGYQTLLLYSTISHGKFLYQELKDKIPCALLSGKDDSEIRNKVKQDLEDGKIKVIVASRVYDIGVDLPSLSGLVLAGGGRSSVRTIQRIGRVLRKHPNKKQAAIIDFIDNAKFLIDHSKIRYKIYTSEEEFEVYIPPHIKWKKSKLE